MSIGMHFTRRTSSPVYLTNLNQHWQSYLRFEHSLIEMLLNFSTFVQGFIELITFIM